jgi:AraC-like DNA-binding protein
MGAREKAAFIRQSDLPGVEILKVENCTRLFSVFHTAYEVCTVLPRPVVSEWMYRGKIHVAGSRGTSFMEPGESHHNLSMQGVGDFRVFFFAPELMQRWSEEHDGPRTPHFCAVQTYDAGVYRTFNRFHASLRGPASCLERQSLLADCLGLLMQTCVEANRPGAEPRREREAVRRAKEVIRERFREAVPLEDLSRAAGLSRFHLARAFKKETGLSPHAFQTQLRIARARELLKTRIPIVEIAQEVGFYDQSHFTHYFKRAWGVTPAEYARG